MGFPPSASAQHTSPAPHYLSGSKPDGTGASSFSTHARFQVDQPGQEASSAGLQAGQVENATSSASSQVENKGQIST